MKNSRVFKEILWFVLLITMEITLYMCVKQFIQDEKRNRTFISSNEFLATIDCAEIFNKKPDETYVITFDIRAEKSGKVLVYQQNGTTARYAFYEYVDVTEEYQTMQIIVEPVLADENEETSILAFYGEYGTGVIPEVRKISIGLYNEKK